MSVERTKTLMAADLQLLTKDEIDLRLERLFGEIAAQSPNAQALEPRWISYAEFARRVQRYLSPN